MAEAIPVVKYSKREAEEQPELSAIELAQTISGSREEDTIIEGKLNFNNYQKF